MAVVKLAISGMHCSSCAGTIERNLQKFPAIKNIKINAISGRAKIAYDETQIQESKIISEITSYGFPAGLDNAKSLEESYIKGLKKRLYIALPLFLMIFALHMSGIHAFWSNLLQLILASIVQFYCGYPFYLGAKNFFKTKSADMNVLIALGTSVAYIYSLTLFYTHQHGFYFEGSSAVICFVLVGEYLKSNAKKRAGDEIALLTTILPTQARCVNRAQTEWIATEKIKKGDKCLVVSGEKIPLDGIVLDGQAEISSAHINGEELPRVVEKGAEVIGGSLILNGEMTIQATKDANEFFVYEMLDLLEISQTTKPPIGRFADKVVSIFVPSIVILSVCAFIYWLFAGEGLGFALSIAASVFVVSCPCALGLAVPLAVVCASLRAKKAEILVKNPDVYEKIKQIKMVVFDKTGTLTKGQIVLKNLKILTTTHTKESILSLAKSMQNNNPHPIAKAIVEFAGDAQILQLESKNYEIAKGVQCVFKRERYFLGSLKWINAQTQIPTKDLETHGQTIALAKESEILALFELQDSLRDNAKEVVDALHKRGVESVILSGDEQKNVAKIAKDLGISMFFANVNPTQKAQKIAELSQKGDVCFIGDGINDALALKEASFGISFAEATQLAQEAGDVLLLKNDLWGVILVFDIAHAALRAIKENLFFAYVYNIILIPIAAGVLYYPFGIILQPAFAGAAMALSSLSVVGNALRISKLRLKS